MAKFDITVDGQTFEIDGGDASQEELEAYFSTPEGQTDLQSQLEALPAEQEPAPEQPSQRDNLGAALGGMFGDEAMGQTIAEHPFSDFLMGVGRSVDQTQRGLKQIAADPDEALVLAKEEEKARAAFEEWDEGLGAEDLGEAVMFLGSFLIPGGAAPKVAIGGSKVLNAIKTLPGTLGGQSLMVGMLEGSKAATSGESQLKNAATGAGLTLLGGGAYNAASGIIKNSFKEGMMGKALSAFGIVGTAGEKEARRRVTGGLASRWLNKLWGRTPKDDLGVAAGRVQAGAERQGQTLQRKGIEAKALEAQKDNLKPGDPVWDSWFDLVKGPKGKPTKTGKQNRRKAQGLAGVRPSKTVDAGKLDVATERNRIVATLMSSAQKQNDETGEVFFDMIKARESWDALKETPGFKAAYTTKLKSGTEKLGTKAQAVEDFLDDLLTKGIPNGQGVSVRPSVILQEGAKDIVEGGAERAARIRAAGEKPGPLPTPTKSQIGSRAAGVGLQQFVEQDIIADAEQNIVTGGWFGFMDYFDSLEEQARAAE